ncbi:uncharacterized protein LOC114524660 [Dendronephthya gigantea]|uniref:uncharacterized protein LOC114524660 n=1 Tax=Dendronephthya gigantea TaxID=151771 RepID=UPI00106BBFD4|nr:uncharacterized protein LOC114524660 [Dendronephthya gigantea]
MSSFVGNTILDKEFSNNRRCRVNSQLCSQKVHFIVPYPDKDFAIMCSKSLWSNVVFNAILFILVHVNKSVHGMEHSIISDKILKHTDDDVFWSAKQKRTSLYKNPCDSESHVVNTRNLDPRPCQHCRYYPATLKEVKCTKNTLNNKLPTVCKYINVAGDCMDVYNPISILRVDTKAVPPLLYSFKVNLKVGCACMLLRF